MDVQGAETACVAAKRNYRFDAPLLIIFEYHPAGAISMGMENRAALGLFSEGPLITKFPFKHGQEGAAFPAAILRLKTGLQILTSAIHR